MEVLISKIALLLFFVFLLVLCFTARGDLLKAGLLRGAQLIPSVPGLTLIEEFKSAVAVALTGTTTETILATFNVPAGLLGANGEIEIEADFTETNNANNKTVLVRIGGTGGVTGSAVLSHVANTVAGRSFRGTVGFRNSAASQRARFYTATDAAALTSVAGNTQTENFQLDKPVLISAILANAGDTITLEKFKMRFYKAV